MHQIDAMQHGEQMQDLQRELERLVAKMEEKGAQITKLRKHQQTVKHNSPQHRGRLGRYAKVLYANRNVNMSSIGFNANFF